jgi:Na+-driven multidrug efflux pump
VVNAARGLAVQVNVALTSFASNFLTAVNPQIIKSYASGDMNRMRMLIFQSSRFALYLMFIFAIPVIITAHHLLGLWLTDVPEHTVTFVRLVLLQSMIEVSCLPLQVANQATGKVKKYQIVAGGVLLLNFPLSYLALYMGFVPESVYIVSVAVSLAGLIARLVVLRGLINISVAQFLVSVDLRGCVVAVLSFIVPFLAYRAMPETLLSMIAIFLLSWLMCAIVIMTIGVTRDERSFVINKVKALRKS